MLRVASIIPYCSKVGNTQKTQANQTKVIYPNFQPLKIDSVSFGANPLAKVSLVSGESNPELAQKIAEKLGLHIEAKDFKKFPNSETYVRVINNHNLQGKQAYIIQPSANPVNDSLIELLYACDIAKRNNAKQIIAVVPYFGYERQDRVTKEGETIAAKLIAKLFHSVNIDKVITIDLHAAQIEGFFENGCTPIHLSAIPTLSNYIKEKNLKDLIVVSPDAGGIKRAKVFAKNLDCSYAIINKERNEMNDPTAKDLIGNVKDRNCIICDDMIDTAGSIEEAVKMLKENGAKDIYVCATHGIFSKPKDKESALDRLARLPIKEVIVTNTLPLEKGAPEKVKQVDISGLIADCIKNLAVD